MRIVARPEGKRGPHNERKHRQHKTDAADGDENLQIAIVAMRHILHPGAGVRAEIIVQRRQRAGIGEGAEAGTEQRMVGDIGGFGLPDRGAAGEFARDLPESAR